MSGRRWSEQEIELMTTYMTTTPVSQRTTLVLAMLIDRSENSVQIRANRMGMKFRNFSEMEITQIADKYENWGGEGLDLDDLASKLGRSRPTVCAMACKMGLTIRNRSKTWLRGMNPGAWPSTTVNPESCRNQARKLFKAMPSLCERCKDCEPRDRHHKDGNTRNNLRSNILFLCRRCHMAMDGRLDRLNQTQFTPRLDHQQVLEIRRRASSGEKQRLIASAFRITQGTVSEIVRGKIHRKKHGH